MTYRDRYRELCALVLTLCSVNLYVLTIGSNNANT